MHCENAVRPELKPGNPTVCNTNAGADVNVDWEQKKLEATKLRVNRTKSPASGARFVGLLYKATAFSISFINRQGNGEIIVPI
jgi:hypothetical protein